MRIRKSDIEKRAQIIPDVDSLQLHCLIERARMINRIHMALRATHQAEDIFSIILATLISRTALQFSRAMLFAYDDKAGEFRGRAALGALNRDEYERLQNEIVEEEHFLANMVKDLRGLDATRDEETLFSQSLRELSSHSFWITTYQKFSSGDVMNDAVIRLIIPWRQSAARVSRDANAEAHFLGEIVSQETSVIVPRKQLEGAGLPPELIELLPAESLWAPIKTTKGVRLLVIVDKIFQPEPLTQIDTLHMDWFAGQVALAIENAEMFGDLQLAYHSLREVDTLKSNFLSTISHELRTPLTAISGFSQLLLNNKIGPLSPGQREILERVLAHSDQLINKVNDLIEIAEIDAGRNMAHELVAVDPLNAFMSILPRLDYRRLQKNITIEPVVTSTVPSIWSNSESLERIFFHLLDNAIKFSHENGTVRVEFEKKDAELMIVIVDHGIGISEHQLQTIFEVFYQVDNQLTRSYAGMGIGLSIIKHQLDLTGGKIEVESQLGRGSVFRVIYPLA